VTERKFKVGETIEILYQAAWAPSDITVNMEIYYENKKLVSDSPIALTELGNSGRYYGEFIPDAPGEWSVQVEKSDGTGRTVKTFSVIAPFFLTEPWGLECAYIQSQECIG